MIVLIHRLISLQNLNKFRLLTNNKYIIISSTNSFILYGSKKRVINQIQFLVAWKINSSIVMDIETPIRNYFDDSDYAWRLLQSQIRIQICDRITNDHISELLELYMIGVERMNCFGDERETFFRNKVTLLMTKPNVVKAISSPMCKKDKHDEAISTDYSTPEKKNQFQLKKKRQEIQMRLLYGSFEHSPEALRDMIAEYGKREQTMEKTIKRIINEHDQKLNERIKQRKLRTMTAKSRSANFIVEKEIERVSVSFQEIWLDSNQPDQLKEINNQGSDFRLKIKQKRSSMEKYHMAKTPEKKCRKSSLELQN